MKKSRLNILLVLVLIVSSIVNIYAQDTRKFGIGTATDPNARLEINGKSLNYDLFRITFDAPGAVPSDTIILIDSLGNFGIGTIPSERFHILGNIRMVDGNQGLGKILSSDANGVGSWVDASTSHTHELLTNGNGLTGANYDGSTATTWAVAYGTSANTAVQGNQTATIAAGTGLTGGIAADALGNGFSATLNVGAGDGIDVAANSVAVDATDIMGTGLGEDASNNLIVNFAGSGTAVTSSRSDHTHAGMGDITGVTAGAGLTGGGTTGTVTVTAAANNGLTVDGTADRIQLGGTLSEATTITQGANAMTFNLNGTGDFRIQDNGTNRFIMYDNGNGYFGANVGIGTTTPDKKLNVGEVGGANLLLTREDGTTTSGNLIGQILFESTDGGVSTVDASAMIRAYASEDHASTDKGAHLTFETKATNRNGNETAIERMRIAQNGDVTISDLAGTGTRAVVASAAGLLSAQATNAHTHATLTNGAGLTGNNYNGSTAQSWSVTYGTAAGTAVQGNQTATITAGSGLSGGISADILGNGFSATLNVGAGDGIDVLANTVAVDVTDILGTGLTESSNNINVSYAGTGSANTAARSDHTHSGGLTGTGTANYISKWTGSTAQGNSTIYDNGTTVALGTTATSASAKLQVNSTTQGFLPPRLSNTQMYGISTPAEGLTVYNTNINRLCFYNGSNWECYSEHTDEDTRKVFITSTTHNGNLGGVKGANSICQQKATAAGLSGVFKAWICDGSTANAPINKHTRFSGNYVLTNGTVVANGWTDLVDATIDNTININELGNAVSAGYVWSNVNTTGSRATTVNICSGWTTSSTLTGTTGRNNYTDSNWTICGTLYGCGSSLRLYCFEQ